MEEFISVQDSFKKLSVVAFELSTRCTSEELHKTACPIWYLRQQYDGYLDMNLIFKVCINLHPNTTIYFHIYNEPSVDCRLSYIIHYLREHLHLTNNISLHTNGWGIDDVVIKNLYELGCDEFICSIYSDKDLDYFQKIKNKLNIPNIKIRLYRQTLDDRLSIYTAQDCSEEDWKNIFGIDFNCYGALINTLPISATGDIILCEMDSKRTVIFGNLNIDNFENIFKNRINFYNKLSNNKLITEPCRGCCGFFPGDKK